MTCCAVSTQPSPRYVPVPRVLLLWLLTMFSLMNSDGWSVRPFADVALKLGWVAFQAIANELDARSIAAAVAVTVSVNFAKAERRRTRKAPPALPRILKKTALRIKRFPETKNANEFSENYFGRLRVL